MGWSLGLGKVAGIRVQIHFTFLIFLAWIVLSGLVQGKSGAAIADHALVTLGIFACVVLHELGHALTAQHYGIRTKDITLLPMGGVARLDRIPDNPRQELWVALAGPSVNVGIATVIWGWLRSAGLEPDLAEAASGSAPLTVRLFLVNVSLVVFNLIPAFPMDGGRVLRAALAFRLDYTRATRMAASLGQGLAVLFGIVGFFANPMLMFIALFVWIGAAQEARMVQLKAALGGMPVSAAMMTNFETVSPRDSTERVAALVLSGSQRDFPVVEDGRVVGVMTRDGLLKALAKGEPALVQDMMRPEVAVVDSAEMLESALQRLEESSCHTLPVLHDQQLVGLLTADNLGEFVMIRTAVNGKAHLLKSDGLSC